MSDLDLFEFITKNELEIRWEGNELLLWISHYDLKEFCDLLDRCDADDGGIHCQLQNDGGIVLDLVGICEEYDIDPENILGDEK